MRVVPWLFCLAALANCAVDGAEEFEGELAEGTRYELRLRRDTFIKRSTAPAQGLPWGRGKCRLFGDSSVSSRIEPVQEGTHYLIDMSTEIPGCEFSWGYVTMSDADVLRIEPPPPPPPRRATCEAEISFRECAMLNIIAYAEGTNDRYNLIFSGASFESYWDHPRRTICANGYCSDAAGRYQFLSGTWDLAKWGTQAPDFGPASQDKAALFLMKRRGLTNFSAIDSYAAFQDALYLLNEEWASLPGSPYGQPTKTMTELWNLYVEYHEALR